MEAVGPSQTLVLRQADGAAGGSGGAPGASAGADAGAPGASGGRTQPVLRLRLPPRRKKGVRWAAGTVDNEHLGRKSSKKCCVYHKPRAFGESDSDDSDSECTCDPEDIMRLGSELAKLGAQQQQQQQQQSQGAEP